MKIQFKILTILIAYAVIGFTACYNVNLEKSLLSLLFDSGGDTATYTVAYNGNGNTIGSVPIDASNTIRAKTSRCVAIQVTLKETTAKPSQGGTLNLMELAPETMLREQFSKLDQRM